MIKWVPFTVHGGLELVVSIALVALPWLAGFPSEVTARTFYVTAGIVVFVVWVITDYKAADTRVGRT